jgi:hypothetical protein
MKIQDGKWVNDFGESLSKFEIEELLELGQRVKSVFGEDITYDRIEIINSLSSEKNEKKETTLNYLLQNENLLNQISLS